MKVSTNIVFNEAADVQITYRGGDSGKKLPSYRAQPLKLTAREQPLTSRVEDNYQTANF